MAALGCAFIGCAAPSQAALVFVGQWQVDEGPNWNTGPAIYSALQVAAMLFGGSPSDYTISTVDSNPANANMMAWYSGYGSGDPGIAPILPDGPGNFPAGSILSQDAFIDAGGDGVYTNVGDYSAYVADWAVGSAFTNYAFRNTSSPVPEPSGAIVMTALMGAGFMWRVRRSH